MSRCFVAAICALLALFSSAHAAHELVSQVYDPTKTASEIRITALIDEVAPSGYMPIRVHLKNGSKIPRTWRLNFTSSDMTFDDEGNEMKTSFDLPCGAKQSQSYDLTVPLVTAFMKGYGSATAKLSVTASAPGFSSIGDYLETEHMEDWPAIMISETLSTHNGSLLDKAVEDKFSSGKYSALGSEIHFGGAFNPKRLSSKWLAYSGYDYCLLTEADWNSLMPGPRSALLRWNRLGGSIIITSTNTSTDLASLGIPNTERGQRSAQRSWGIIMTQSTSSAKELNPEEIVNLILTDLPKTVGNNRLKMLREEFSKGWSLQILFGSKTAHALFFIIILILFGILVGPINLFVFAKAGQRHRLFITTPIISLGASLLLIGLILLQDGFGGRGTRVALMEVRSDNGENAAYISQEQVARTGVLLSTGFETKEELYLSPVMLNKSRWARVSTANNGGSSRFTAKVREDGLNLTGDWFKSRSEHGHYLETVRPTRGRIELSQNSDKLQITSTFDFPLKEVIYTDQAGTHWKANDVQQGSRVTLAKLEQRGYNFWKSESLAKLTSRNRSRLSMTADRKNHFVATTDSAKGLETLDSINWSNTHTIITGSVFTP